MQKQSYAMRGMIIGLIIGAFLMALVYQNAPGLIGAGMGVGALLGCIWLRVKK